MSQRFQAQKRPWDVRSSPAEPNTAVKRRKESEAGCSAREESLTTKSKSNRNKKTTKQLKPVSKEEAQKLVWKYRDFLKDPNIVCLNVGPREVKGKKDRQALIFHVVNKQEIPKQSRKIPKKVQLKKTYGGKKSWIPTDVVETGRIVVNKAEGGSAICVESGQADNPLLGRGTLCAILPSMFGHDCGKARTKTEKTKLQLITCAHLINYEEKYLHKNLRYLERDRYVTLDEAGNKQDIFEEFLDPNQVLFPITGFVRIKKYRRGEEINDTVYNELDVLWADVDERHSKRVSETIVGQPHAGIREVENGEKFTLTGITSGEHNNCKIIGFPVASLRVEGKDSDGEYSMYWKNLIRYKLPTRPGDSGAALISKKDRKIIGLHAFGPEDQDRDNSIGYACQLHP